MHLLDIASQLTSHAKSSRFYETTSHCSSPKHLKRIGRHSQWSKTPIVLDTITSGLVSSKQGRTQARVLYLKELLPFTFTVARSSLLSVLWGERTHPNSMPTVPPAESRREERLLQQTTGEISKEVIKEALFFIDSARLPPFPSIQRTTTEWVHVCQCGVVSFNPLTWDGVTSDRDPHQQ